MKKIIFLIVILLTANLSCVKENNVEIIKNTFFGSGIVVETLHSVNVGDNYASVFGKILKKDNNLITNYGHCWSKIDSIPTITDNHSDKGTLSDTAVFTSDLTGLQGNYKYYYRAYAINKDGVTYGAVKEFTTVSTETGQVIFWVDSDPQVGNISVSVDGNYGGLITQVYSGGNPPPCGTSGSVTLTLLEGAHSYTANGQYGGQWQGNLTIVKNDCINVDIY